MNLISADAFLKILFSIFFISRIFSTTRGLPSDGNAFGLRLTARGSTRPGRFPILFLTINLNISA